MGILVRRLAIIGISLCVLVIVVYTLTRNDLLNGFLAGITLAMAMLPEEFPVVLTIFLAIGAWRMSMKNVLTRKPSAIETLGSATVLCTDKTGTLTQNKMTVTRKSLLLSSVTKETVTPEGKSTGFAAICSINHGEGGGGLVKKLLLGLCRKAISITTASNCM